MTDRLLTVTELSAWLRVSRSTIYRMLRKGELPRPLRLSRRRVGWREADIRRWLARR